MAEDMQGCEACAISLPIEQMISHGEIYLCPKCDAEAREAYRTCDHELVPSEDDFGDPARYCVKCGFLVPDETTTQS